MWESAAAAKSFQTVAAGDGRERRVLLPHMAAASPCPPHDDYAVS